MIVIDVNKENFDNEVLESDVKVLVVFNADWCGPCQMLKPVLEELSEKYKIVSVNVDDNMELAREYGIMTIPCLILFKDGNEVAKLVGLHNKEDLLKFIEDNRK